jgi:molybdopterin-guanine dinucleotide biosynthesis protein A
LLERKINDLSPYCGELIVVAREPATYADGSYRTVCDLKENVGPLMGLYTGLRASKTRENFVTAVDMPFFSPDLFKCLLRYAAKYDAVVPRVGTYLEPLFALYSQRCLPPMEAALQKGRRRLVSFFGGLNIRYVEEAELRLHDGELISFLNINTDEDWARALELARENAETGS